MCLTKIIGLAIVYYVFCKQTNTRTTSVYHQWHLCFDFIYLFNFWFYCHEYYEMIAFCSLVERPRVSFCAHDLQLYVYVDNSS